MWHTSVLDENAEEFAPEPLAKYAVDDKVDRAVKGDKEVACLAQCMDEDAIMLKKYEYKVICYSKVIFVRV